MYTFLGQSRERVLRTRQIRKKMCIWLSTSLDQPFKFRSAFHQFIRSLVSMFSLSHSLWIRCVSIRILIPCVSWVTGYLFKDFLWESDHQLSHRNAANKPHSNITDISQSPQIQGLLTYNSFEVFYWLSAFQIYTYVYKRKHFGETQISIPTSIPPRPAG